MLQEQYLFVFRAVSSMFEAFLRAGGPLYSNLSEVKTPFSSFWSELKRGEGSDRAELEEKETNAADFLYVNALQLELEQLLVDV